MRVNIVGIGPGNPDLLTLAAKEAIEKSNILIGDKRMLSQFQADNKRIYATIKTNEIVNIVETAEEKDEIAVLVSGDVGFFSLAQTISGKLPNCECVRFCGISSLIYFASKLNMAWNDIKIVSMHGRSQNLVEAVAFNHKVFSLTGGTNSVRALAENLCKHGFEKVKIYVGENLSYPDEKVTEGTAEELSQKDFSSLAVMIIINEEYGVMSGGVHGLNDELFIRSKVPMTKQEVRSVSMSKLMPGVADVIYDIGAGTGSCSVELALIAKLGKVYAFERNPQAVELLHKNRELFGLKNLEILSGEALENIKNMPTPNCVFIGGSGGDLCDMLDIIYSKNYACRVVINAITVETLAEVCGYYKEKDDYELEIVSVSAARNKKLGNYNLMMAQNPVYVMTALKKEV